MVFEVKKGQKQSKPKKLRDSKGSEQPRSLGGRPEIPVDLGKLEALVKIQCTAEECASVIGCSVDTIDRRLKDEGFEGFADYRKKHEAEGRASLRRMQWKKAQDGDRVMLIWLGKQYLGQRDRHEVSGDSDQPVVSEIRHRVIG